MIINNKHKSILVLGAAKTNYMANNIVQINSAQEALYYYGQCPLTEACNVLKKAGLEDVFAMNVSMYSDFGDAVNILQQCDFAYIVATDIMLSSNFYDPIGDRKWYHIEYLAKAMLGNNLTTILVTDKHAFLYETVDDYLNDMKEIAADFAASVATSKCGQDVVFVANNLENYSLANVALAVALCTTDESTYPDASKFGNSIFIFDNNDIGASSIAYFKNSLLAGTTVENLVNFYPVNGPQKSVVVDRIIKYIIRELDLGMFRGKPSTAYTKACIEKRVETFLESIKNWLITQYEILSIRSSVTVPGAEIIKVELSIVPVYSSEKVTVVAQTQ